MDDQGARLLMVPDGRPEERRLAGSALPPAPRVVLAGVELVSPRWQGASIQTSFWRLYQADGPGVSLRWAGGRLAYPVEGAICIPGWLRFTFHWREPVLHRYVHFEPLGWTRAQVERAFPAPFILADPGLGAALRQATAALPAERAWAPACHLAVQGVACQGLAAALGRLDPEARARLAPDGHGRFAAVAALVEERLDRPLGVAELAAAAGLRPQPFIRAFRRATGTTPGRYVIERRVARACRLLVETGLDLPAVAAACGFPDRNYLSRMFARAMGQGPAAYRRSAVPG